LARKTATGRVESARIDINYRSCHSADPAVPAIGPRDRIWERSVQGLAVVAVVMEISLCYGASDLDMALL
jgi:hypothetical protein